MNIKRFERVIIVSGRISSGKTTLSKFLAEKLNCPTVSISSFLKKVLVERNVEINRNSLQTIGESIYKELGEAYIIENTMSLLNEKSKVCILDGIRYPEAVQIIKDNYTLNCTTIYLDLDSETRFSRNNENLERYSWEKIDNSFTELACDQVKKIADIVFCNPIINDLITAKIISYISLTNTLNVTKELLTPIGANNKVLCVGQLTEDHYVSVDRIPINNQFANVTKEIITYGGNATNSAYCFAALGCKTYLYTQTSKNFPKNLLMQLKRDKIDTTFIKQTLKHHPKCYMYFSNNESANFYTFEDHYKPFELDLKSELFDLILISGTLEQTYCAFRSITNNDKNNLICWSPGYETRFLKEEAIKEFINYTDILIVSEYEYEHLNQYFSNKSTHNKPKIIIITMGERGSKLCTEYFEFHIPALSLEVRNAYGAGDYFAASFSLKYLITNDEIDSVFFATQMTSLPLSSYTSRLQ